MLDILRPVMALSLFFQKKDLDIGGVKIKLDATVEELKMLADEKNLLEKPTMLSQVQEELIEIDGKLTYKGHEVIKSKSSFRKAYKEYIEAILRNLQQRFPETELMAAFSVLAMRLISFVPTDKLEHWGKESLEVLLGHFGKDKTH